MILQLLKLVIAHYLEEIILLLFLLKLLYNLLILMVNLVILVVTLIRELLVDNLPFLTWRIG